jgi:hypothetical protein
VLVVATCVCAAASGSAAAAGEAACPNNERRIEQGSTYLPDCRAYELVSPPDARPLGAQGAEIAQAAVGGAAVAWMSFNPPQDTAGQSGSQEYLSRRSDSSEGWSTVSVIPPQSPEAGVNLRCPPSMYLSPSLSRGVLSDGWQSTSLQGGGHEECVEHNEPALVSEPAGWQSEPEGRQNLFLADLGEGGPQAWRLINRTPAAVMPGDAWFEDAATGEGHELNRVVFEEAAQLTGEAPAGEDLYEWADGVVRLVTFLPDGQATVGELANGLAHGEASVKAAASFTNAVSADGSRVFFTAGGNLYVRLHADREPQPGTVSPGQCVGSEKACTIQVDTSQAGGPGGGATFLTANPAGTEVFFTDAPGAGLTSDTEPGSGENLYEYEVDTGRLSDLTGDQADVRVLGYSGFGEQTDGAYHLYFVAEGTLGSANALAGRPNLYSIEGQGAVQRTAYVATLNDEDDRRDWGTATEENEASSIELLTTRTSPDGRLIAFTSTEAESIAGYDNTPVQPQECAQSSAINGSVDGLCREVFLYEAGATRPVCVSCHFGARPTGPNALGVPGSLQDRRAPAYLNRYVLDDGRVFFDSPDPLVTEDANGVEDVYEYHEGHVSLISSGTSPDPATFLDASADGTDVFFTTGQRLLPGDASDSLSLYDARVDGGFAEPAASQCEGEGCRGSTQASPAVATPATSALTGPGNLEPAPVPAIVTKPKPLTRRQQLTRALNVCKRDRTRRRRVACERTARRRYGVASAVHSHSSSHRTHRRGAK